MSRVEWTDALRVLQRPEARQRVSSSLRAAGFRPDHVGLTAGRSRAARSALADALTWAEDWLEMEVQRSEVERAAIRGVRRRLEWELWP